MYDILAFVQTQSNPLSLATPVNSATISANNEDGSSTFAQSFFSIILGELTQESPANSYEPSDTLELISNDLPILTQEAKSIDEHLLEDLLSVIQSLQEDSTQTSFPTLNTSPTLDKLLASEATRQEFAAVKNVSELVALSEKYNLGLEKITVSQESLQSLQTKFSTLKENAFFDDLEVALNNTQTKELIKPLTNNVINFLDKQTPKTESKPTPSILSELIAKESTQKISTDTTKESSVTIATTPSTVNEKQQTTPLETMIQKALNPNKTEKIEAPLKAETVIKTETLMKSEALSNEESTAKIAPALTTELDAKREKNVAKVANDSVLKTEFVADEEPLRQSLKSEEIKTTPKTNETKPLENMLKTVKLETNTDDVAVEEVLKTQKTTLSVDETATSTSDETQIITTDKTDIKTTFKQELNTKSTTLKESLNQFASDLQEKIETYKPPIMKVELALSPKNLGEVDVTLLTRGNNLHVNISSNTTTMSLFTQNQAEVKSALINMGFTNLEMNFSDQRNSEQSHQNQKQNSRGNVDTFTTETSEEETTLLEIVIPQYV
ncbi:flagellar hook-length control protein FliK [Sulfurospirillum barnesii]|uniref:Flagellar hook-length control protein FliK n=1 Tax=Sulfurospirillum barnesii (strain ATCC 700032 / DSM 10660 / SES-3) TaxID=760154 RepID=I3Y0U8_SULBS|nr:flagellar hook-length control protein FliK [Sulfurospirillum barnesii]AFL69822.1 Flagellar hook-length control protein FliK [Sulfurospirillum barnesii SES-3]